MQWFTSRTVRGFRGWWACAFWRSQQCSVELAASDAPGADGDAPTQCSCGRGGPLSWIVRATSELANQWFGAWLCNACTSALQDTSHDRGPALRHQLAQDFAEAARNHGEAFFAERVLAFRRDGYTALHHTRWSSVMSPWIWLAADDTDAGTFTAWLSHTAQALPMGTCGLSCDGATAITRAFEQTRFALRCNGVADSASLITFLHQRWPQIVAWVRQDSRFAHSNPTLGQLPQHAGQYLQDYIQEYILSQATEGHADHTELVGLGAVLQSSIAALGMREPAGPMPDASSQIEALSHFPSPATQPPQLLPQQPTQHPPQHPPHHSPQPSPPHLPPCPPQHPPQQIPVPPQSSQEEAERGNAQDDVIEVADSDDDEEIQPVEAPAHADVAPPAAWDAVDLEAELRVNVPTLPYIPTVIRGPFLQIYGKAVIQLEAAYSRARPDQADIERRWKEFILLPRMLLYPSKLSGSARAADMRRRVDMFRREQYGTLLAQAHATKQVRSPRGRTVTPDDNTSLEGQWEQALKLIGAGQLSRAAKLLHSPGLAPRDADTLAQLSDPTKRPVEQIRPFPQSVTAYAAQEPVRLDGERFLRNLRSARKGGAPGPSGSRNEHLKPLLEDDIASGALEEVACRLANADVPASVGRALVLCRMVGLRKGSPGLAEAHGQSSRVRGLAVGDVFRRLVSRTLAQQHHGEFETATSPHQFGISSRSGVAAAVHLLRTLTDYDPNCTVTQIDGIGAFDHMYRAAMLEAVANLPQAHRLIPYLLLSYGQQSTYLWEDQSGVVHDILQGEGGEQGDALMPALFSLGLASALREIQASLREGEMVIAYLDDLYLVSRPDRAKAVYDLAVSIIRRCCGVEPNLGKTVCWNRAGAEPAGMRDLGGNVWRGGGPDDRNGIRVLGAPLGSRAFAARFCEERLADTQAFRDAILRGPELQHVWLLIYFCLTPRINHLLRQTPPSLVSHGATCHDSITAGALAELMGYQSLDDIPADALAQMRLPPRLGGLGLRDSSRLSPAAYWASWADCLPVLVQRFPAFGNMLVNHLAADPGDGSSLDATPSLAELQRCRSILQSEGLVIPTWTELASGISPPTPGDDEEFDPGEVQRGWQRRASGAREDIALRNLFSRSDGTAQARLRSSAGSHNARWLTAAPTCEALRLRGPVVQFLFRRRLGLQVIPMREQCEASGCNAALDPYGFHRSACTRTGRIHGRHAACVAALGQVLSEAGYRVRTERLIRDTNVAVDQHDRRRMDLVASPGHRGPGVRRGLALFCDVTIVSPHSKTGIPRCGSARANGATLRSAISKKHRRYSDVSCSGVAAFVVLGCEVYGRWCDDAVSLLKQLAAAKAREAPPVLRAAAKAAWLNRWWAMASIGVQRAVGEAQLCEGGADLLPCPSELVGPTLTDVVGDHA